MLWYNYYTLMEFEFAIRKSESNSDKHGIDFITAQALWHDEHRLVVPARCVDEPRAAIIAMLDGVHWTGIFTVRNDRIRLISVRRSRDEEKQRYNQVR